MDSLLIILFLVYSIILFFINNYIVLFSFLIINIILGIILKLDIAEYLIFLKKNILFIIMVVLFNLIFSDIISGLVIGYKLFILTNMGYMISKYYNNTRIRRGFYYILYPLKVFKIDIDNLSLIITISLTFIPIFIDEINNSKLALKSMGCEFKIKNVFKYSAIFIITFLNKLLDRVDEIELYLIASGYNN